MSKHAVLSMDIEDWYHLYYFQGKADTNYSMIDGFENYVELLNKYEIKTTFFVLSELKDKISEQLKYAVSCGHEIACHGKRHIRPLDLSIGDFEKELTEAKDELEKIVKTEVSGYRAPCYGINNEHYAIIEKVGFKYSSSMMNIKAHPLYGNLNLDEFSQCSDCVYAKGDIVEFPLSTKKFLTKNITVSGGGWIRLLPWKCFMKPLIQAYLKESNDYYLYIHPFELSEKQMPRVDGTGFLTNIRARKGLHKVENKIEQLILELKNNNFEFVRFIDCYNELCAEKSSQNAVNK